MPTDKTERVIVRRSTALPAARLGLRARATIATALGGLAVSVALSLTTYLVVRSYLLSQRTNVTERQAFTNARIVRDVLRSPDPQIGDLLATLRSERGSQIVVRYGGTWYGTSVGLGQSELPTSLRLALLAGESARQRFELNGRPQVAVGVSIPTVDAAYVEIFPLDQLQRTLWALRNSLLVGSLFGTVGGATLGFWSSRRVLQPVTRVAGAAEALAQGGLGTRLPPEADPDLHRLVDSFNGMADAIQLRIEREARFASDVSHELRTPLAALTAASEVLERRRDDLPERAQQALDILVRQLQRFTRMVLDLLEISRLETGTVDSHLERVALADFTARVTASAGYAHVPVEVGRHANDTWVEVDKRRFESIVTNLLDNARLHGGGAVRVGVDRMGEVAMVWVDDAGPGVPFDQRDHIFERFARGPNSNEIPGTGLGLALVSEHARLLGATVTVRTSPEHGARFAVTLPVGHEDGAGESPDPDGAPADEQPSEGPGHGNGAVVGVTHLDPGSGQDRR